MPGHGDQPRLLPLRLMAGYVGNVLEWYDFAVYGFVAVTISQLFFPDDDPFSSLIATFATFAVGFAMRPLGALLFGPIGDRFGRRRMLVLSTIAMASATVGIGLLPTHADIGAASAVLLVALRMVQGLSIGGEYVGSGIYLAETAPVGLRGLVAGLSTAGLFSGMVLGSAVGALTIHMLSPEQMIAWGWRLPFLGGLVLGVVALSVRLVAMDAPRPVVTSRAPLRETMTRHGGVLFHAIAIIMVITAEAYALMVYVPAWLAEQPGVDGTRVLADNATVIMLAVVAGLAAAALSDRWGRKPVLLAVGLSLAVLTLPLFLLIGRGDPQLAAVAQGILLALTGCYACVLPATLAEMFPWRVRSTAGNLSLNLSFAAFGGTAPMIATWLTARTGDFTALAIYLSVLAACSVVACLFLEERRGVDLSP